MSSPSKLDLYNKVPQRGISWRAILAGTVAAVAVMIILNLIGLSFGLWSVEPAEEGSTLDGLGVGAIIWWVVSNLIVLFIGGFVAARVGVSFTNTSGIIQGIMTWALYTLVSAWLITSVIGTIVSGVGNVVGKVISTTGNVVENQLAPVIKDQFEDIEISLDDAKEEFYSLLEDTEKEKLDPEYLESQAEETVETAKEEAEDAAIQPGRADAEVEGIFSKTKNRFEQSFEAIDKEALANILQERTDMTESEAQRSVENLVAEFEQARAELEEFVQDAKETAEEEAGKISDAVGDAAMYLAIALVLGLITAGLGGLAGVKNLRSDRINHDHLVDETGADYGRGERR